MLESYFGLKAPQVSQSNRLYVKISTSYCGCTINVFTCFGCIFTFKLLICLVIYLSLQRGNDVRHSPVMYAYLVVEMDGAKLFVDDAKVTPEVMEHLTNAGIELRAYESILSEVER